ncbi:hypothetical protein E8L99_06330 [Phreatobacter aquaticus]|uniref:Uncharacterized protein n=1 Tax=Phreatobacter aquaticus TaxID=2570229 RepID=A0A4D7QFI3_9HYPH|nr:DUF6384 family protein [Phreatobacter aquaticus]QCK85411.1 hypothetical protein E8L99_06330 [Phreatobacter aquaticus]
MTDTAVAPTAPPPAAPLDDVMLAMDVVDTLRHQERVVEKAMSEGDREEDLVERLRQIYRNQGIEVSDEVIRQGVKALREERFAYKPPADSLSVKLARIYVTRGTWGKWALGAVAALAIGFGTLAYQGYAANVELTRTIPAEITRLSGDIAREATADAAKVRAAAIVAEGQAAVRDGKADLARKAVGDLERLRDDLRAEYDVRIVSRRGEQTGFWRDPPGQSTALNYYLVVEAIDRAGRALPRTITEEEGGSTSTVTKWAVRVPRSLYDEVRREKETRGFLQNPVLGSKARGQLEPTWRIALPGGAITRW